MPVRQEVRTLPAPNFFVTLMAKMGISEFLNHKLSDRWARVYVQNWREAEQEVAFDKLGRRLNELRSGSRQSNVITLPSKREANTT